MPTNLDRVRELPQMSAAQRSAVLDGIEQELTELLELLRRPAKPTLRLVTDESEKGA